MTRLSAFFIALAATTALPAAAATLPCTQETLNVSGTAVTLRYCVDAAPHTNAAGETVVSVAATYSAPGGSFSRSSELHFVAGEPISRVLESLNLTRLGLTGTLHLTLAYAGGLVRVEGALLTPGAITIK